MLVFGLRLTTFVTEVLARRFELRWFDDVCNVGRPLVARPGPAAAHGYRRLALLASWAGCLKPLSPLRVPAEPRLKPSSPLRVRNGRFWCIFRLQWCCRFQWSLFGGEQWCRWFHAGLHQWLQRCYWLQSWHVAVFCARKSSPCLAWCGCKREEVRPARSKWHKLAFSGVLGEFFRGNADGGVGCSSGAGSRRIPPRITSGPPHTRSRRARVELKPRSLLRRLRNGVAHALLDRLGDRGGHELGAHESREQLLQVQTQRIA